MEKKLINITIDDVTTAQTQLIKTTESKTSNFNTKNYLNTKLSNGETERDTRIRIIPVGSDNSSPFKKIFMHNVAVPKDIAACGYKNYICVNQTNDDGISKFGKKCPFCELRYEAYKLAQEAYKNGNNILGDKYTKISCNNIPSEHVILRCIERGNEDDGPKFWNISIRNDKSDAFSAIMNLYDKYLNHYQTMGEDAPINIFDLHDGFDILITFAESITADKKRRVSSKITLPRKQTVLSSEYADMERWVYDDKKWYDVFAVKPYEYLSLIIDGKIPWFDRTNKIWVDKDDYLGTSKTTNEQALSDANALIGGIEETYTSEQCDVLNGVFMKDEIDELPI